MEKKTKHCSLLDGYLTVWNTAMRNVKIKGSSVYCSSHKFTKMEHADQNYVILSYLVQLVLQFFRFSMSTYLSAFFHPLD